MIDNDFTEALKALDADGQELLLAEDGAAKIGCGGVEMTFVVPETAQDVVYCRAAVGSLDGLDGESAAVALLSDNFMWQATNGGTLSVRDGAVYLTDRRDARFFAAPGALSDYIRLFAETVRLTRERLETFRPAAGKEVR